MCLHLHVARLFKYTVHRYKCKTYAYKYNRNCCFLSHDDLSSHSSHLLPTNRYSVQSNLIIETEDSIPELQLFRKAGGQTVVDVSSIGIRRKIEDVPKIARESGVNIITGTGYYVDFTVPEEAKMMTVQEVYIQL